MKAKDIRMICALMVFVTGLLLCYFSYGREDMIFTFIGGLMIILSPLIIEKDKSLRNSEEPRKELDPYKRSKDAIKRLRRRNA